MDWLKRKICRKENLGNIMAIDVLIILICSHASFKYKGIALFASIHFLFGSLSYLLLKNYFSQKKERKMNKTENTCIIIWCILYGLLIIGTYFTCLTKHYNLYYIYYVEIFSFVGLIGLINLKGKTISMFLGRDTKEDRFWRKYNNIIFFLFTIAVLIGAYSFLNEPKKMLYIQKVVYPDELKVSLIDARKKKNAQNSFEIPKEKEIKIKDDKIIHDLYKKMENKNLENIRGVRTFNYDRLEEDLGKYLDISGVYEKENIFFQYEKGYITSMRLYSNGTLIIYVYQDTWFQSYSIQIGEKITQEIINKVMKMQ